MPRSMSARRPGRLDVATVAGLALAVGGIVGGLVWEGGHVQEILKPTAAVIVLGGTFGAVLVTSSMKAVNGAIRAFADLFFEETHSPEALVEEIVGYAAKARKSGVVSLEQDAETVADPFLQKALTLAVDGTDLQELRRMMELEIEVEEHQVDTYARVFESAGGYAPTIGIIGAVLGLIQVMKHLADIDEVGKGIATAFVATIYGVGFANVLFLPAGGKLRARAQERSRQRELVLEGVISIVEGMNPKMIRSKLAAYCAHDPAVPRKAAAA